MPRPLFEPDDAYDAELRRRAIRDDDYEDEADELRLRDRAADLAELRAEARARRFNEDY